VFNVLQQQTRRSFRRLRLAHLFVMMMMMMMMIIGMFVTYFIFKKTNNGKMPYYYYFCCCYYVDSCKNYYTRKLFNCKTFSWTQVCFPANHVQCPAVVI